VAARDREALVRDLPASMTIPRGERGLQQACTRAGQRMIGWSSIIVRQRTEQTAQDTF